MKEDLFKKQIISKKNTFLQGVLDMQLNWNYIQIKAWIHNFHIHALINLS